MKHRYNRTTLERLQGLSIPEPNSGCYLWLGRLNEWGYGVFRIDGKTVLAHRASWEEERGEIPEGMKVCHSCDNPPCINPSHLWLGTDYDNTHDSMRKGRQRKRRGEQHGNASITEIQALEIISAIASGEKDRKISNKIGCSKNIVSMIRYNRIWKHLAR